MGRRLLTMTRPVDVCLPAFRAKRASLSNPIIMLVLATLFAASAFCAASAEGRPSAPPDSAAHFTWNGRTFTLNYDGTEIFKAAVENPGSFTLFRRIVADNSGRIDEVFKWYSKDTRSILSGTASASRESFACQSEPRADAPLIVMNSCGLSRSLLNRAVYDREFDWLISVDFPSKVVVVPHAGEKGNTFHFEISGHNIILRFRPGFYRKHRGLKYFKPWTYQVWKKSVAGWSSWFAYRDRINQKNIEQTADVLRAKLVPYGLSYLQIDDGYERPHVGPPDTWLIPNSKFPSGLAHLSHYIRRDDLRPGIWTNVSFQDSGYVSRHIDMFVRERDGHPAHGEWVGYVMDGSNPSTADSLIDPVYAGLRNMGWQYYKVDALRHLRYEGYNSFSNYFTSKDLNRVEVYRHLVRAIKDDIGPDSFMLGCWGIRPELAGIIDACRVGSDGFGFGGFSEYNSFNNVVWRNDPDHIQLSAGGAYADCMVTSLTGSLFMLTDKPEIYETPVVEAARRSIPILFTQPEQVYDVNPIRSDRIAMVNTELSGGGPRPFDADQKSNCDLYELEIDKPFEDWVVLGRTGTKEKSVNFRDLGLGSGNKYVVFQFWTGKYLGVFKKEFKFPAIDQKYGCQLFCIRKEESHPQLLATNRHVSCGGYDLVNVKWQRMALAGTSKLVGGEGYNIYLREPPGYKFVDASCEGAKVVGTARNGVVRTIELKTTRSGPAHWTVRYTK